MEFDTDVLIVGSGPAGLMLACQLARFGVSFKIIDKQVDRTQESRAFGIQARSMEVFQNIGVVSEFLKRAQLAQKVCFYVDGKQKFKLDFTQIEINETSFPSIYLLPQAQTEEILLDHLKKLNITVERQTELLSFNQTNQVVEAELKKEPGGKIEKIHCRYIVGCDGAHSTVRHVLGIPFVGASYRQEFILADAYIQWPFQKYSFNFFMCKDGVFAYVPLHDDFCRLVIAASRNPYSSEHPPSPEEIEGLAKHMTRTSIPVSKLIWATRFHLHHRAVDQYQKGLAFLAGDSAHIHSPIGGQGMNTGLQDATNLAWKLAFVLKYQAPEELLITYQTERHRIGEILLRTTDRVFGWVTSGSGFIITLRRFVVPIIMRFLTKSSKFLKGIFSFISELSIHYHENPFVVENHQGADAKFLAGPKAGYRAPDAPIGNSTLFELFREKPCNILLFQPQAQSENQMLDLKKIHPDIIAIHQFKNSADFKVLFDRYGIRTSGVYLIRPDGYIGFRSFGSELDSLLQYLRKLFGAKFSFVMPA